MKTNSLLLAALFLSRASYADVEDKINKTFTVQPGDQLLVEVDRGSIEVKTADSNSVDIEVTRKAGGTDAKAKKTLEEHVVTTTQDANKVEVHAEFKGAKTGSWFGNSAQLNVQYRITVPRKFDLDLKTAGGSIKAGGLTGKTVAHTSGGSLNFEKLEGPLTASTSGGSVTVNSVNGKVDVKSSGGSLHLTGIAGDVSGKTSGGSITAEGLNGKSELKTSGGSLQLTDIKGQIEASTSGGSINAEVEGQPAGDCSFKTSGGSVTLALSEKAAVEVDLRTSAGRVTTDLPVTSVIEGEQKKNAVRGKINGGGPLITAHTSAGSVQLHKN